MGSLALHTTEPDLQELLLLHLTHYCWLLPHVTVTRKYQILLFYISLSSFPFIPMSFFYQYYSFDVYALGVRLSHLMCGFRWRSIVPV